MTYSLGSWPDGLAEWTEVGGYPSDIGNPDQWAAFLRRYLVNRVTNEVSNGIGLVALHIADAIQAQHAEELRLSQGLCAIAEAAPNTSAAVLRSVAHDIVLNCITPDVARFQLERRGEITDV